MSGSIAAARRSMPRRMSATSSSPSKATKSGDFFAIDLSQIIEIDFNIRIDRIVHGLQVLRRHRGASFMAQAFVFPGGARDGAEDLRATMPPERLTFKTWVGRTPD